MPDAFDGFGSSLDRLASATDEQIHGRGMDNVDSSADRFDPKFELIERHDVVSEGDPGTFDAAPCVYRLGFAAVDLDGFPGIVRIGRVEIRLIPGPLRTTRTQIQQRKPPPLLFDKHMEHGVEVGGGRIVLLCEISDRVGNDLSAQMDEWRVELIQAVGLLTAVLDDRLAREELLEDVLIFDEDGGHIGTAERISYIRHYYPRVVRPPDSSNLASLGSLDLHGKDKRLAPACRYYRKGVLEGPPDSVVHFWTALEALRHRSEKAVPGAERLIAEAGLRGSDDVSVQDAWKLRNAIVHEGAREHDLLPTGHYFLEALVRGLIRHMAGVGKNQTTWPLPVDQPLFPAGPDDAIPLDWVAPRTIFHENGLPPARNS